MGIENKPEEKKRTKIVLKKRREFVAVKDSLCEKKLYFEYVASGNVETIHWNNLEYVYLDSGEMSGKGHHLNRIFKKDIDDWIRINGHGLPEYQRDYSEQMFNLTAIENNLGNPSRAIDLNDCYWRMTFKIGYITEKTYISGLRKKEWKTGRNACIGSLFKTKVIVPYVNGEPDYKMKTRVSSPIKYMHIRNHIIGEVYKMFLDLQAEIGDRFYMFLTDCVFTDDRSQKYVEKFFHDKGFRVKSKAIDLISLDRAKRKIYWFDYEASVKDKKGNTIGKKGMKKTYQYASHQIIDGIHNSPMAQNDSFLTEKQ